MEIEFQLSATAFEEILRVAVSRFLAESDVLLGSLFGSFPFGAPLDFSTVTPAIVDRVEVRSVNLLPGAEQTVTVETPHLTVGVPVTATVARTMVSLFVAPEATLAAAGPAAAPDDAYTEFQLQLDLSIGQPSIADGAVALSIEFQTVSFGRQGVFVGSTDTRLPPEVRVPLAVLASVPVEQVRLDLGGLTSLAPGWVGARAGLARRDTFIALRLELEPAPPPPDPFGVVGLVPVSSVTSLLTIGRWTSFFAAPRDRRDGNDWALALPSRLFTEIIDRTVVSSLDGEEDIVLHDDGHPSSTWSVLAGPFPLPPDGCARWATGHVDTTFTVTAVGACPLVELDLDVHGSLAVDLSMRRTGYLRADLEMQLRQDDGDVALCALTNAAVGAFTLGGTLLGAIAAAIGLGIAVGDGVTEETSGFSPGGVQPVDGSPNRFWTEFRLPNLSSTLLGEVTPVSLMACRDGLLIRGTLRPPAADETKLGPFTISNGFEWRTVDSTCPPTGYVASASLEVYRSSRFPALRVATPVLQPPTPSSYAAAIEVREDHHAQRVRVELRLTPEEVEALSAEGPASVQVFVQTNLGSRIITFPGVDAGTVAALDEYRLTAGRICAARRRPREAFGFASDGLFGLIERWRDRLRFDRPTLWSLGIVGLAAAERVSLVRRGEEGTPQVLGALHANARGAAVAALWSAALDPSQPIALDLALDLDEQDNASLQVTLSAQQFAPFADVALDAGHRDHAIAIRSGVAMLATASRSGLRVFTLGRTQHVPRLRARSPGVMALENVRVHRGDVVAWGAGGLALARGGEVFEPLRTAVLEVHFDGDRVLARTCDALWAIDLRTRARPERLCACGEGPLQVDARTLRVPGDGSDIELRHCDRPRLRAPTFTDEIRVERAGPLVALQADGCQQRLTLARRELVVTN